MSTELRALMHPSHAGRLLGVNETARIIGVSERTMRRWLSGQSEPSQRSLDTLRKYLRSDRTPPH